MIMSMSLSSLKLRYMFNYLKNKEYLKSNKHAHKKICFRNFKRNARCLFYRRDNDNFLRHAYNLH